MKRLILAVLAPALVGFAPREPGEVTAVSVLPGAGRAYVMIDVRGSVGVQDFSLERPPRLVIDVTGATLRAGQVQYDGRNRGGILNVRYSQFRPDVVRIVIELDALRDYDIEHTTGGIRVALGADRSFAAWSSAAAATRAPAAPPREPTPLAQAVAAQQPRVTATWDSAPIADVTAGFAELSGKSIILGRDVTGFVTAKVFDQPWDVAFQVILQSLGLDAREDPPGIIRVDDQQTIARRDSIEPLQTTILPVNYARAAALVPVLKSFVSQRGEVVADTGTNSLIITDLQSRLQRDSALVARLDVPTPQVSIQAKIIFVDRTDVEELGVRYDLGGPTQFFNQLVQRPDPATAEPVDTDGDGVPDEVRATGFFEPTTNVVDLAGNALSAIANAQAAVAGPALQLIFSTAIGNFALTSFVDALQRVDLADVQAEPLITSSDNTPASILVGERTPIRVLEPGAQLAQAQVNVQFQETGIKLNVTPHVTANRQVLLSVEAERSDIRTGLPDVGFTFGTQRARSQVLVNDGQTAVIGGLTVTDVSVAKSGIPFLVDLPLIGGLFGFTARRETRRDLLILVTPHIIEIPAGPSR